ncbi:hypothetical protein NKH33_04615 [Mesorhizobium sp. M1182]|uniref:hypothetical protein n=1 Tax=unclassified Mesorhizobium TaxID=325217 RepID=UPI0033386587
MSGRGTSGGVVFQAEVGAYVAGLLLAERPVSRMAGGLPGVPRTIRFETPTAVDDLLIETDRGEIYVQAKRTISLSSNPGSELASAADQFVRQFRDGIIDGGVRRDFDPSRDRLVLAVGSTTAATVANNLREALDRNRTGAATAMPNSLGSALRTFSGLIDAAWNTHAGIGIKPAERQSILACCSVVVVGDGQRQTVEDGLRDVVAVVGDEAALLEALISWAATASGNGTGGDAAAIRLALAGKARLVEPPSYRDDVQRLNTYSAGVMGRLERFTQITSPEGHFTIARPVTALTVQAARGGLLAITGEPGSGKSAIVREVAQELAKEATVVVLTVEAVSISADALRIDIGLQHSLIDVLAQMPGDRPAYLVLDALDAARGGLAEATYKRLVEEVSTLPGWHVIASVRTFDLRLGREWRRLFAGTAPQAAYADPNFSAVRHIHIGLLSDVEKADVAVKSPILASAIEAGGPKMEGLARNPFNLALLGDLLHSGVAASTLSSVATRGELLERYWDERISEFGLPAVTSLKTVVTRMLTARSIDLPETDVPDTAAKAVDDLQRVGVLVTEQTRRIGFRHHVLFDYAVARLILLPDRVAALEFLSRASGAGLLVTPSLGYWLEALKATFSAEEYWSFVVSLIGDDAIDPIVRIEVARLPVESVHNGDDLTPLADALTKVDPSKNRAFQHIVGSLMTKSQLKQPIAVDAWATLLEALGDPNPEQLGSFRALIGMLIEDNPSPEALRSLGKASRVLFDAMSTDESRIRWLASHVVPFVAKTIGTDPGASRKRLDQIFSQPRFSKLGFIEVPWLARESLSLAEHDEEFVVQLFYRVFRGGEFSRDQVTSMSGSWILSLTSNAAQDFAMSTHSLASDFPQLLLRYPRIALRAFAAAIRGERERSHPARESQEVQRVSIAGVEREFEQDYSHIWAWNADDREHDDYAKLYRAVSAWGATADDQALLTQVPELILSETGIGLAWRSVFEIAASKPDILGREIWKTAASVPMLKSLDTRRSAISAIAATFPHLSSDERAQAETDWLQLNFAEFSRPDEVRVEIIGTLFETIGESQLVTETARAFLRDAKTGRSIFENGKPLEFNSGWTASDRHWLEREGIDVKAHDVAPLLALVSDLRSARDAFKAEETLDRGAFLWNSTLALGDAVAQAGPMGAALDQEMSDALAEGLGIALSKGLVPTEKRDAALGWLLELTHHSDPELKDETEERFADFPSWGSPSPRIEAAQALAILATQSEFWPLVRERYQDILLNDPHPAVRFQLVRVLPWIEQIAEEEMWTLAEKFLKKEKNATNLKQAIASLSRLAGRNPERLEALAIPVADVRFPKKGDDPLTGLIVFFAVNKELPTSKALLFDWTQNYKEQEERLQSALFDIRNGLIIGFDDEDPEKVTLRRRTQDFLWILIAALEPAVKSWPSSGNEPTPEEVSALKLFNEIADQIYYAVGHDEISPELAGVDAKRRFLKEYAPFISKLTTLGTPGSVHHLLSVLSFLMEVDPEQCFDLISEAMLRTTGVARYEHESMGATLFVKLIGWYLADYRSVFEDEVRRRKLVDCLALFVEAGWPEARRLFQSLPELLQ